MFDVKTYGNMPRPLSRTPSSERQNMSHLLRNRYWVVASFYIAGDDAATGSGRSGRSGGGPYRDYYRAYYVAKGVGKTVWLTLSIVGRVHVATPAGP